MGPRIPSPRARTTCPCLPTSSYVSLYIRVHVCRVCIWVDTYALRRYSNTRPNRPAWRYQVSNGPNVRKSPKGAYRGRRGLLFLTKSSRTRAAGNFIRCPYNNTGISRRSSRAGLDGYTIGHFGNPCLASGEWQLEGTTEYPRDWRTRPSLGSLHAKILEPDKFGFSERRAHPSHSSRTRALSSSADLSSG